MYYSFQVNIAINESLEGGVEDRHNTSSWLFLFSWHTRDKTKRSLDKTIGSIDIQQIMNRL